MRAAAPGPSLSELLESEKRRVRSPMNPEKLSHEHRKTTINYTGMHALSVMSASVTWASVASVDEGRSCSVKVLEEGN